MIYKEIDLRNIHLNLLKEAGKGTYGIAYEYGDYILKHTHHEKEYEAACELIYSPQLWACNFYEAKPYADSKSYLILREKVTPIKAGGKEYPGHFAGIQYQEGNFKGYATRPAEFNGELMPYNHNQPFLLKKFQEDEMEILKSLYENTPFLKDCLEWFMKTYWDAKEKGFFVKDLWCNIGINKNNEFVIFDVMKI